MNSFQVVHKNTGGVYAVNELQEYPEQGYKIAVCDGFNVRFDDPRMDGGYDNPIFSLQVANPDAILETLPPML